MKISITSAVGYGPTRLAAFDAALQKAGIANFNLIRLSSIIPPGSQMVQVDKITTNYGKWGDRLYVVYADHRINTPNVETWAGIGWVQDKKTGQGLLVEHENYNESTVRKDIEDSLNFLMKSRKLDYGKINMVVAGAMCTGEPVCALSIAVFQASDWENKVVISQ